MLSRVSWRLEKLLDRNIEIEYRWVPGHAGNRGNEAADKFAKKGAYYTWPRKKTRKFRKQASLTHINRKVTERCSKVTREWIDDKLQDNNAYQFRRKMGMREVFKTKQGNKKREKRGTEIVGEGTTQHSKKDTSIFFQITSGHALIGTHLKRFKQVDHAWCGWCEGKAIQSRGHLMGRCARFKKEYRDLVEAANRIWKKEHHKQPRKSWKAYHFLLEEGYEHLVISYLKKTGIGHTVNVCEKFSRPIPIREREVMEKSDLECAPLTPQNLNQGSTIRVDSETYNVVSSFPPIMG